MLIIFDLDDTLIETTNTITPIVLKRAVYHMMEKGLELENKHFAVSEILKIHKTAYSSQDVIKKFLEKLQKDPKYFDIAVRSIYSDLPSDIKIFTLKNAKDVLSTLYQKHKLAIVTMGVKNLQYQKLKKAGIDTAFFSKIVVTQNEKGWEYKKLIEELNIDSSAVIVVGDKIRNDLMPAKKMGCTTVHMRHGRGKNLEKDENVDFQINELNSILEIINKKIRG